MPTRFRRVALFVGIASLFSTVLTVVVGQGAPSFGANSRILIGAIGDLTGVASSTFGDGIGGATARIDLQNAEGGVDGHKLKLVIEDDESSSTQNLTASEDLVSKGVFGIDEGDSAYVFGGAKYLQQQGIPVTGGCFDGPEWNEQPNTNMFCSIPPVSGPTAGTYWTTTYDALFLKSLGVSKLATFAYGISPSSSASLHLQNYADTKVGITNCLEDDSVPFGGTDFTATVLQLQQGGCDGVWTSFVDSSDVALSQAIKNAGLSIKGIYSEGYDDVVLGSASARASLQGAYFASEENFTTPNAPTQAMLASLKKYDPSFKGGIPDLGTYDSWLGADMMIDGLQHAGANPTRAAFIKNLRKVDSYNAGGILSTAVNFSGFGTAKAIPKTACEYFVQLKGSGFVVANKGKPLCGQYIPVPESDV